MLAHVGPDDFLIDLGSGDGRIPIAVARTYGAKAPGVDLDPWRIREAREKCGAPRGCWKVGLIEGALFSADISKATVVALFLSRPRLRKLAPGTRIVSHEYDMGQLAADRQPGGAWAATAYSREWSPRGSVVSGG